MIGRSNDGQARRRPYRSGVKGASARSLGDDRGDARMDARGARPDQMPDQIQVLHKSYRQAATGLQIPITDSQHLEKRPL